MFCACNRQRERENLVASGRRVFKRFSPLAADHTDNTARFVHALARRPFLVLRTLRDLEIIIVTRKRARRVRMLEKGNDGRTRTYANLPGRTWFIPGRRQRDFVQIIAPPSSQPHGRARVKVYCNDRTRTRNRASPE